MASVDSIDTGPHVIGWDELDKRKLYVIGPAFSLAVRAILYPPMLIKTRLQVQNCPYNGTIDAFRQVIRLEGYRALYKGFLTNCMGLGVGQVYITTYEISRKHAGVLGLTTGWKNFVAGAAASTVSQGLIVPIDVVTQLQMVQGQSRPQPAGTATPAPAKTSAASTTYQSTSSSSTTLEQRRLLHTEPSRLPNKIPGVVPTSSKPSQSPPAGRPSGSTTVASHPAVKSAHQIAKSLYQAEGMRGLYRGYFASFCTYVPNSGIWWASYGVLDHHCRQNPFVSTLPTPLLHAVCGGAAGLLSSLATNPVDVIRTRLQVEGNKSAWKTVQTMWREDGPRWLARGAVARIMSAVPSGAVIITSYETVKRLCVRT